MPTGLPYFVLDGTKISGALLRLGAGCGRGRPALTHLAGAAKCRTRHLFCQQEANLLVCTQRATACWCRAKRGCPL